VLVNVQQQPYLQSKCDENHYCHKNCDHHYHKNNPKVTPGTTIHAQAGNKQAWGFLLSNKIHGRGFPLTSKLTLGRTKYATAAPAPPAKTTRPIGVFPKGNAQNACSTGAITGSAIVVLVAEK